jgi:hypothetical protein
MYNTTEKSGLVYRQVQEIFLISTAFRPVYGPSHILTQYTAGLFPEVRWREHETDHLLSSSAEVKNAWGYTSIPPYVFMA